MNTKTITTLAKHFEDYVYNENGLEFWYARDLQKLLGYVQWRKFLGVIDKAKESCKTAGNVISDHFAHAGTMVTLGSGSERKIDNLKLTRYACYLIAQNGDPRKEAIAFAQTYFAIKTRKQELIEERIKLKERFDAREELTNSETELSKLIFETGAEKGSFARVRSKGDSILFGGNSTKEMKVKLNIPDSRPLADYLPTVTIAAKNFATEMTNFGIKHNSLNDENKITTEHLKNNSNVREVMLKSNMVPETLPPEEDIKKLERRVKKMKKN